MALVNNNKLKSILHSYGYDIMNVTWEDTSRTKGSCWGPNISDMTLNIPNSSDGFNIAPNTGRMPVIRKPNFADVTFDLPISELTCPVNNDNIHQFELSKGLETISFKKYLENIAEYTSNNVPSMYLPRDEKILTSTQYCLLPCATDAVKFNVNLYNYQQNVLTIVVSSQGTSCQVIDNENSILYFNKFGKNADFLVERLKVDRQRRGVALEGAMTKEEKQRNVIFIYQVPLKPKPPQVWKRSLYSGKHGSTKQWLVNGASEGSSGILFGSTAPSYNTAACCTFGGTFGGSSKNNKASSNEEGMEDFDLIDDPDDVLDKAITSFKDNDSVEFEDASAMSADSGTNKQILEEILKHMEDEKKLEAMLLGKNRKKKSKSSYKKDLFKGFDEGILSTTEGKGVYHGTQTLRKLERDDRYPIRLTIQHYKVMDADTTDIPTEVILEMVKTLDNLYQKGTDASSLVFQDTERPTESVKAPTVSEIPAVPVIQPTTIYNF